MRCEQCQQALSALMDGEQVLASDVRSARAHVASCAFCRDFEASASRARPGDIAESGTNVPDLAPSVVRWARLADRRAARQLPRWGLVAAGVALLLIHTPPLLLGADGSDHEHAARHGGAFGVAFAIGLLVVAGRPAKARGLLPVTVSLAVALFVTGVIDVGRGQTPLLAEAGHLPEIAGALLVWLLSIPAPPRQPLQPNHTSLLRLATPPADSSGTTSTATPATNSPAVPSKAHPQLRP